MNLETSYLVHWLTIASPTLPKKNLPWQGRGQGQVTLHNFTPHVISPQWLETSDFVHGLAMWSLGLVMSECSLSGRGLGHVSNFYFVDLENFATASRQYTGDIRKFRYSKSSVYRWYTQLDHCRFVYDTWDNESDSSRYDWVHIVYNTLPQTKPPTSYHRFGQDLSYK